MYRQLGYGTNLAIGDDESPSVMGPVAVGAGFVDVALGQMRSCGLYDDGNVRCWGMNNMGQLGYGNTVPTPPGALPESLPFVPLGGAAVRLFAGAQETCAVLANGSLKCWGANQAGQLGLAHRASIGDDETPAQASDVPLRGEHRRVSETSGVLR